MNGGREQPRPPTWLRVGLFVLGVGAFALWMGYVWIERHDLTVWDKDWYCFYSAGGTYLSAGAREAYVGHCNENYFWMYPPYMFYPYALASWLPPLAVYLTVIVEIWVATICSLRLIARSFSPQVSTEMITMFILGSGGLLATLVVGQHSALLLLGVAGGTWALHRDRDILAGLFLGLLGIKPNWAVVFIVWLLVSRRWRVLMGMAGVGAVMILSTLPMGLDAWQAYLTIVPEHVGTLLNSGDPGLTYPAHKLITAEAFTRSTIGALSPSAGTAVWLVLELVIAVSCLIVWLRSSSARDQIAVAVLAAVAGNLYAEFYDTLVLALPAAVWWASRHRCPRSIWLVIGSAALGIWMWQWLWVLASPGPGWPSAIGGFLVVWIVAEALRAVRGGEVSSGAALAELGRPA